jgi:hypothetical protein
MAGSIRSTGGWRTRRCSYPRSTWSLRTDRALGPVWCVPRVSRVPASARVNGREQVMVCRDDGQLFGSIGTEMVIGSRGERFFVDRS